MPYPYKAKTATILSGASLSNGVFIGGRLASITIPASWTAADLTFQGSPDGVTFTNVYDAAGNEVVVTAAASREISIDQFNGAVFLKVRSGTSGVAVAQGGDRALTLLVERRPIPVSC